MSNQSFFLGFFWRRRNRYISLPETLRLWAKQHFNITHHSHELLPVLCVDSDGYSLLWTHELGFPLFLNRSRFCVYFAKSANFLRDFLHQLIIKKIILKGWKSEHLTADGESKSPATGDIVIPPPQKKIFQLKWPFSNKHVGKFSLEIPCWQKWCIIYL